MTRFSSWMEQSLKNWWKEVSLGGILILLWLALTILASEALEKAPNGAFLTLIISVMMAAFLLDFWIQMVKPQVKAKDAQQLQRERDHRGRHG